MPAWGRETSVRGMVLPDADQARKHFGEKVCGHRHSDDGQAGSNPVQEVRLEEMRFHAT